MDTQVVSRKMSQLKLRASSYRFSLLLCSQFDYTFFSFTTLTTVGYGNMVPVGAVQGLALLEAVIGAMYPPIMIGRLLTLLPESRRE